MNHNLSGSYNRIILRPLTHDYIEQLRLLRNRDDVRCWFLNSSAIGPDEQETWYTKYTKEKGEFMFAAFEAKYPDRFIGSWGAYNFSEDGLSFEAGRRMIAYDLVTEKGLGYDILCCGLNIIFTNTSATTVYTEVISTNDRSINSNLRAGYSIIGKSQINGVEIIKLMMTKETFYNNSFSRNLNIANLFER